MILSQAKNFPFRFLIKPTLGNLNPSYNFVIMKMLKKKFKIDQQKYEPKPHTYSYTGQQQPKKQQQQEVDEGHDQPQYDFFARQRQMDLKKDFRKLKMQSNIIPQNVGKGGFDQIVYWSQNAKTPEQIVDLVKAFNRSSIPKKVEDILTFQEFVAQVKQSVYLSTSLDQLKEYAYFGYKFSISEKIYWRKIEEKTIRMNTQVQEQLSSCIEIAYIMSKKKVGQTVFSTLLNIFKKIDLSLEHSAKLLITYYNIQDGDKNWIKQLQAQLISNVKKIDRELLIELLEIFKQLKTISTQEENRVIDELETMIEDLNFRQLCIVGGFIGHEKKDQKFWARVQKKAQQQFSKKTINTQRDLVLVLQFLSSYSLSNEFVRKYLLQPLRKNQYKLIQKVIPQLRSYSSKIIYIYQMQKQAQDIQQVIQSSILRQYQKLDDVDYNALIKILRDYAVTRNGSRQFYIFIQQVIKACFDDIKKDLSKLQQLCKIYDKSNLCSPKLLEQIQYYLD